MAASVVGNPQARKWFFHSAWVVLKEAGIATTVFGAKDTDDTKLNDNLGVPDDPRQRRLSEFVGQALRR
jgi:hypothetical protein